MGISTLLKDPQALYEQMDAFVNSKEQVEEGLAHLSYSDGVMAAVIVGPEFIAPDEWRPLIVSSPSKQDEIEASQLVNKLALLQYHKIRNGFAADERSYEPFFWQDSDDRIVTRDWAEGFLSGMRLRLDAWDCVMNDDDRILGTMLYVLLQEGDLRKSLIDKTRDPEEVFAAILKDVPDVLFDLYDRFADRRLTDPNTRSSRVQKIGRNEPCPCGSGKKYKKCCLN